MTLKFLYLWLQPIRTRSFVICLYVHSVTIWELLLDLAFNALHLALLRALELSSKDNDNSDPLKLKAFKSAKVSSLLSTLDSMLIWVFWMWYLSWSLKSKGAVTVAVLPFVEHLKVRLKRQSRGLETCKQYCSSSVHKFRHCCQTLRKKHIEKGDVKGESTVDN